MSIFCTFIAYGSLFNGYVFISPFAARGVIKNEINGGLQNWSNVSTYSDKAA